jgi:transcription antitermination factor NusG
VRSRHEKSVLDQLEAKEYQAFLPLYAARRRWADRWKILTLPLFAGYVFCRFDTAARSRVLATPGVIDVVRTGPEPALIESCEIEAIRLVVNSRLNAEPYPSLVRGQRVVVTDGPLKGVAGTLMQVRNGIRLVISIELLRRSVQVEIERDRVIPSEPKAIKLSGRESLDSFASN